MLFSKKQPKIVIDEKIIDKILDRGLIVNVLPSKNDLKKKLLSGDQLSFYIGADPTSTALHLSHAKNYLLLEEFRKLGHKVFILFGDFTARIGDPSDEDTARSQLSRTEVKKNVETWLKQIKPLIGFNDKVNPAQVVYNHDWLSKLSFEDVMNLASHFTVQHMLERDMFDKRIKAEKPVYLHEFLYPLMQGYDSVALDIDVEIGGTDQTFNMLAGRTLLKRLKNKEKFVVAVHLLENPKTKELMSKSRGTGVFLNSLPNDMYGEVMAQPDEMTEPLFQNLTRIPLNEIQQILKKNQPRDAKKRIAYEIVKMFYGEDKAQSAQRHFESVFSKKETPKDIPTVETPKDTLLLKVLLSKKIISSKSEGRRLFKEGAVRNIETNEKVQDPDAKATQNITLKIGKRRFIRIHIR